MGHGRKNSHIVGKIPTWSEKRQEGVHEGINNQVILFKFPYMRTLIICWPCPGHMYMSFSYYIYVIELSMCSDGLGVRWKNCSQGVPDSNPLLEQFLLKTMAVNSILGNRNMIGKIPTWWENSVCGNRKTAGKNSAMVGEKSLPLHGSFSTAAPVLYAGIYLPLFSQWRANPDIERMLKVFWSTFFYTSRESSV